MARCSQIIMFSNYIMEACNYFYDPTESNAQFVLYFDQDAKQEQR